MKIKAIATILCVVALIGMVFIPSVATAVIVGEDCAWFSKSDYPYDTQLQIKYMHHDTGSIFQIVLKDPYGATKGSWTPARNYPNIGTITYSLSGQPKGIWKLEWTSTTSGFGSSTCNVGFLNIRGYVVDSILGTCLVGATVTCSGVAGSVVTGTNGYFTFTASAGNHVLTAYHSTHLNTAKSIVVARPDQIRFDVSMPRISGYPAGPNLPSSVDNYVYNWVDPTNWGPGYANANSATANKVTGICKGYVDARTQNNGEHNAMDAMGFLDYDFVATADKVHVKFAWTGIVTYAKYYAYDAGYTSGMLTDPEIFVAWNLVDHSVSTEPFAGARTYTLVVPADISTTPVLHQIPWAWSVDTGAITVTSGHVIELNCWIEIACSTTASTVPGGSVIVGCVLDMNSGANFATLLSSGIYWT